MSERVRCHETVPIAEGCECVNDVHQTPLPKGYMNSAATAEDRFADGWLNPACPDCGHFGWLERQAFTAVELAAHDELVRAEALAGVTALIPDDHPAMSTEENGRDYVWITKNELRDAIADPAGALAAHDKAVGEQAITDVADLWAHEGRGVMFNRNGDDLSPNQRVEKWLRDRAAQRAARAGGGDQPCSSCGQPMDSPPCQRDPATGRGGHTVSGGTAKGTDQ